MKIVVTGGAGFIGSNVVRSLILTGHDVLCIDDFNDYYDPRLKVHRWKTLCNEHGDVHLEKFDIGDKCRLNQVFAQFKPDAVINLAARAGVRASVDNPNIYFMTNVLGCLNLLEAMRSVDCRKFVIASTSSLYAGSEMPFSESNNISHPISPYAASKLSAEALAYTWHHLYGIDVSVLRYFTVYGPAGRPDMSPFRFTEWVRRGQTITLYGDGSQSRDFTYVTDIADGTSRALDISGYNIINLGGGRQPTSISTVIARIAMCLKKEAIISFAQPALGDMEHTYADISKARELLDWTPQTSVVDGIESMVRWHVENNVILDNIQL
jgi:UDP-glucuronate 4-epimerase